MNRDEILLKVVGDVLRKRLESIVAHEPPVVKVDPIVNVWVGKDLGSVAMALADSLSWMRPLLKEMALPSVVQIDMKPIEEALGRIEKLLVAMLDRQIPERQPRHIEITNSDGTKTDIREL